MMRNYARDKTIKNLFKKFNMPRRILQYFVIITINFHMILWGGGRGGEGYKKDSIGYKPKEVVS